MVRLGVGYGGMMVLVRYGGLHGSGMVWYDMVRGVVWYMVWLWCGMVYGMVLVRDNAPPRDSGNQLQLRQHFLTLFRRHFPKLPPHFFANIFLRTLPHFLSFLCRLVGIPDTPVSEAKKR